MPGYWFTLDSKIVKGDDFSMSLTFSDAAGDPVDISSWTFAYEANEEASGGTGNITVADGAMTKSNSGAGTTDTVSIPIADTVTDALTVGRYRQDVKVTDGSGNETTVAKGTLTIYASEFD